MAETREEVLGRIGAVRDALGDDFHLKIERRPSISAFPGLVATIEGARVEHIATPESWLPRFIGGGIIQVKVFHATDRSKMIGMVSDTFNSQPKEPDLSVLERPDWNGPRVPVFPLPKKSKDNGGGALILVPPDADGTVPRSPVGGGVDGGPSHNNTMEAHFAQRAQALHHAEQELADRKRQMEIDAIKKEAESKARAADERVKNLERQLDEIRNRPPPAPVAVAPAADNKITELLLELRKMDAEQRRADREAHQEQRRVERESLAEQKRQERETNLELARIRADADKASAASQAETLRALVSKPAIDPQIMELMGKNDTSKVLADMAAVVSSSLSNQLNVMSAITDMGMGREPAAPRPPKISGWDSAAKILVPIITRAFSAPVGTPPGQVINQPVNPAAPKPLPATAGSNGSNSTSNAAPTNGAAPQATQAPATDTAAAQVPPVANQIADLIKLKSKSPKEIAELILQNINDASVQTLAISSKGDPRVLFDMMLADWLDDASNRTYAAEILRVTLEEGIKSGVFADVDGALLKDVPNVVKSFIESENPA